MISRISLCIGGITWCLQPRCEFAASFWVCSLVLNMWPHSDKEYAQLSKRDRVVLRVGPLYIIWYTYCLVVCLVKQYQTNQHINNIFIEHVQAKTLSLNTPDIISQFHQIGSKHLPVFASVYLKKTPQIFPSSVTLLETNFSATTLNFCSF